LQRRAESKMHQAYSEAHRFESKASAQRRYEEEDEEIKAKLIKIARERADALRAEDKRSEKVEGIRERLEDALAATQQTLGLRAKRLDQLKVCHAFRRIHFLQSLQISPCGGTGLTPTCCFRSSGSGREVRAGC